jgi:hypothetical protein
VEISDSPVEIFTGAEFSTVTGLVFHSFSTAFPQLFHRLIATAIKRYADLP